MACSSDWLKVPSRGVSLLAGAMGKPNTVRAMKKGPHGFHTQREPKTKKDKERAATLAGLRAIRAPVVARPL